MEFVNCSRQLLARAMGNQILRFIQEYDLHYLAQQVDSDTVALLNEILAILDAQTLDDPECFYRIDAIIRAFHRRDLYPNRHLDLE